MLNRKPEGALPSRLSYEQARSILETRDHAAEARLAHHADTPPEMLYFLAEHGDVDSRMGVAANEKSPIQADALLARDADDGVRTLLASRISRLMPHLAPGERTQLREQAIAILEALARDRLEKVRAALAAEVAADPRLPKTVLRSLANDPALSVCGPVLQYSPLLTDAELIDIINAGRTQGALACIASRAQVSPHVADRIVTAGDVAAVAALLNNRNAQIREDTLDAILDGAPSVPDWHEPLVLRANLSQRAVARIASFVSQALLERLVSRHALPLLARAEQRLAPTAVPAPQPPLEEEQVRAQAAEAVQEGWVDDAWVTASLERGDTALLTAAVSLAADVEVAAGRRILSSRNGRAICALSWKAGLSARTAHRLQTELARVPEALVVAPKDGLGYPQTPDQMEWLLSTFTQA
jgi:uncharacterized protein (DUF2336 family)